MKNVKSEISTLYILLVVWFLAILFSAVMFTISLVYDVVITIFISGVTGVLSMIGVFYTGSLIIKLSKHVDYIESKANI